MGRASFAASTHTSFTPTFTPPFTPLFTPPSTPSSTPACILPMHTSIHTHGPRAVALRRSRARAGPAPALRLEAPGSRRTTQSSGGHTGTGKGTEAQATSRAGQERAEKSTRKTWPHSPHHPTQPHTHAPRRRRPHACRRRSVNNSDPNNTTISYHETRHTRLTRAFTFTPAFTTARPIHESTAVLTGDQQLGGLHPEPEQADARDGGRAEAGGARGGIA